MVDVTLRIGEDSQDVSLATRSEESRSDSRAFGTDEGDRYVMSARPLVPEPALIAVNSVSKTFTSKKTSLQALNNVSLTIGAGEFVVVVGASGCGKTTLLNILAGFLHPDAGRVEMHGRPLSSPGPDRGVVFQKHALYEWLSVRDNIELGLKIGRVSRAQRRSRSDTMLKLVGLEDFADRRIYELSGGMQQRVGLARALANDPEVLLMDEPFAALDAIARHRLQGELLRLWKQTQKTFFLITHSVEEAVLLGTTIVVMGPARGCVTSVRSYPFSQMWNGSNTAELRRLPDFVAACEQLTSLIEVEDGAE